MKKKERHQFRIIVACVLSAAFFWLMNAFSKDNYDMKFSYPIMFIYDDSLYVPVQPLPSNVNVNVTGDGWSLLRKSLQVLHRTPVHYTVVNPLKVEAVNSAILRNELIEHFPGLRVNYVVSDTLELGFERRANKIIALQVDSAGINLRPGYTISSFINVSPSLISVDGPQSRIQNYPDQLQLRIPKMEIEENYEVELEIPLREDPLVKMSHSEVYVSFEVSPQ